MRWPGLPATVSPRIPVSPAAFLDRAGAYLAKRPMAPGRDTNPAYSITVGSRRPVVPGHPCGESAERGACEVRDQGDRVDRECQCVAQKSKCV
jgi:hypothetical protein